MGIDIGPGINVGPGIIITQDVSGTTPASTTNMSVVSTSPFVAGGKSYSFNGASSFLTYTGDAGTNFGTGDFTVEMFLQYSTVTGRRDAVWWGVDTSNRGGIIKNLSSTNLTYYISPTVAAAVNYAWTPTLNTWYHIALVRISNSTKLYVDGTAVGTPSPYTDNKNYGTGYTVYVGRDNSAASSWFGGLMTNLRICKGVGVYTGNFTVPTTQLTFTQSAGTNISAITAGQCSILMLPS